MLKEQLQKQIEQEGKAQREGFESKLLATVADSEYCIGAEKYAALWQAAEEKAARYEKALKEIEMQSADLNLALAAMLNGYQNLSIYQKDWFTVPKDLIDNYTKMVLNYEALTPKTGEE